MITKDLDLLSVPPAHGDYGVVNPINAWPGAATNVVIYMAYGEQSQIIQTGHDLGKPDVMWQRYRDANGPTWTAWEQFHAGVMPDVYVELIGDTMTGPLILMAGAPKALMEAAPKSYVDQMIAAIEVGTYRGEWQVASNVPDLVAITDKVNGDTWRCKTVDPLLAEQAPVSIPGIGGLLISDGDMVIWNAASAAFAHVPSNALTIPEGDARYVNVDGDQMTGPLLLAPAAPVDPRDAAPKEYVDIAVANGSSYQELWRVAPNIPDLIAAVPANNHGNFWTAITANPDVGEIAPAGLPGIAGLTISNGDTIRWNGLRNVYEHLPSGGMTLTQADARYLQLAGGVMAGTISMAGVHFITGVPDPVNPDHAASKQYADTKLPVSEAMGTPDLGLLMVAGVYTPAAAYIPADAPAGTLDSWTLEVRTSVLDNIWQQLNSASKQWSRHTSTGGVAWSTWVENGAATGSDFMPVWPVTAGAFNALTERGNYYPLTAYVPGNPPANPGNGNWTLDVRRAGAVCWQILDTDVGERWFRWTTDINNPANWTAWQANLTSAMAEELYLHRAGDTMEGALFLDVGTVVGGSTAAAATQQYVHDLVNEMMATGSTYQGIWNVATNVPDIVATAKQNGFSWRCKTVDPLVPETPPAGVPGLSGLTLADGDLIIWSATNSVFDHFPVSGMTQPEADLRYLKLTGGILTGLLDMRGGDLYLTGPTNLESRRIQFRDSQNRRSAEIYASNGAGVVGSDVEAIMHFTTSNGGYGWRHAMQIQVASPPAVAFDGSIIVGGNMSAGSITDRTPLAADEPAMTMRDQLAMLAAKVDELTTKLAALEQKP